MVMELFKRLWAEETGQGMAEYGLILALVAVAVIGVLGLLGSGIGSNFSKVAKELGEEVPTP